MCPTMRQNHLPIFFTLDNIRYKVPHNTAVFLNEKTFWYFSLKKEIKIAVNFKVKR